jgi:NitT/TauT family transport system permease protein
MTGLSTAASKTSTPRLPIVRALELFVSASWGTVLLLVLWLMATRFNWLSPRVLPDPVAVLNALGADLASGLFWDAIGVTVLTSLIGLAIGGIAGGLTAFTLSDRSFRWLYVFLRPYFTFLNSTPRIVLVPFFILIFGIGPSGRIALAVSLVFFVMFFGVFGAVEAVRPEYLRSAYIMGASRLTVWRVVLFPATLPGVFDSLRISVSLALLGVVVAEIISTPSGIGGLLRVRGDQYDLPGVFSALIVLGALSAGAMAVLAAVERRLFQWK